MSHPPPPPHRSKTAVASVETRTQRVRERREPSRAQPESRESEVVYRAADFEHSVHLDAHGNILAGNGQLEELASLAAYVCRLANLVGDQLCFGEVTGLEAKLANGTYFMHRELDGEIVSIKPRAHLNLIQLRAQLNL